jgi:hypothetical protein
MTAGYLHPAYARSLREFGEPRELPDSGGWILVRSIPGSGFRDAMGPYPLFCCRDWKRLPVDLQQLRGDAVTLAVVPDPFGGHDLPMLRDTFSVVRLFKDRFVHELAPGQVQILSKHHRYYVRKALALVEVDVHPEPSAFVEQWVALYGNLVKRHALRGLKAFSASAFAEQLALPGTIVVRARRGGETVGAHIWYLQDDVAYSHLLALSDAGYEAMASYALYAAGIEYFARRARWLDLGAGAGVSESQGGLAQFKRGFSTGTRPSYFCGWIGDPVKYAALGGDARREGYFPSYRAGEF